MAKSGMRAAAGEARTAAATRPPTRAFWAVTAHDSMKGQRAANPPFGGVIHKIPAKGDVGFRRGACRPLRTLSPEVFEHELVHDGDWNPLGYAMRSSGAYSSMRRRSTPSSANRTVTTPSLSIRVTTPSPRVEWRTESPVESSGKERRGATVGEPYPDQEAGRRRSRS